MKLMILLIAMWAVWSVTDQKTILGIAQARAVGPNGAVAANLSDSPSRDTTRPPTDVTPSPSVKPVPNESEVVKLKPETVINNPCFSMAGKPFKSFSEFGQGTDELFYGVKNGQLVLLKALVPADVVKLPGENGIDSVATLLAFQEKQKITKENCDGVTGRNDKDQNEVPSSSRKSKPTRAKPDYCEKPGMADGYVLSISWQPAFCEGKGRPNVGAGQGNSKPTNPKPECELKEFLQKSEYHASNFTLHGLWPNRTECGENYGYCSEQKEQKDWSRYLKALPLNQSHSENGTGTAQVPYSTQITNGLLFSEQTQRSVSKVMPNFRGDGFLILHEWFKHGTCSYLNANEYFKYASDLVEEINRSALGDFVRSVLSNPENPGRTVTLDELNKALDKAFGDGASRSMRLICKDDRLEEIMIPLACESGGLSTDTQVPSDECKLPRKIELNTMVNKSIKGGLRRCGKNGAKIIIDEIGYR